MERVYFLALPMVRHKPMLRDPFEVSERALTYRMTKRIEKLATRKKRPEVSFRIPGAVSPAATKARGSNTHLATTFTTVTICFAVAILPLRFLRSICEGIVAIDPKEATFSLSPM